MYRPIPLLIDAGIGLIPRCRIAGAREQRRLTLHGDRLNKNLAMARAIPSVSSPILWRSWASGFWRTGLWKGMNRVGFWAHFDTLSTIPRS
jgi:hypothetical protein